MAGPLLPKRVLYALRSLLCLAETQRPVRAEKLARFVGIPPCEAAKVLYLLTWGGFVSSRRGSKGGFWLCKPPEEIRVKEVVGFFQVPTNRDQGHLNDPVLRLWEKITAPSYGAFENLNLADLVRHSNVDKMLERAPNSEDDLSFVG